MTQPVANGAIRSHRVVSALTAAAMWRPVLGALVSLVAAGVLAGCANAPTSVGSSDTSTSQQGTSGPSGTRGITVFGEIDAGVTRQRSR